MEQTIYTSNNFSSNYGCAFMCEIPSSLWIAGGIAILCILISIAAFIKNEGDKYDLNLFFSLPFLFLTAAFICVSISFFIATLTGGEKWYENGNSLGHIYTGAGAYIFAFIVSHMINAGKSNFWFGLAYTLLQAILSAFAVMAILLYLGNRRKEDTPS